MGDTKISKFMSLVLRHEPHALGIVLDENGWIDFADFAASMSAMFGVSEAELQSIVATNDKKRFIIRDGRIRANQGHSIGIDLSLTPTEPPEKLYHGTIRSVLDSIMAQGLLKGTRDHVHLSKDQQTAEKVAVRRAGPWVVLQVAAQALHNSGTKFYMSENLVWLVEHVPAKSLVVTKEWGRS